MLESDLWRGNNERLSEVTVHLSSQNVEVVRRSSALGKGEVNVLSVQVVIWAIWTVGL